MRAALVLLLLTTLAVAGSAPAQPAGEPLDATLQRARAEQATAEKEATRLDQAAVQARGTAARLRAQQEAAAQAIEAAEARITASDAQLRLASAYVAAHRHRIAREQQPVSALLAGLAVMARRPPLLALAGGRGTDELVEVRILLNSTLPVIRSRTRRLSDELAEGERLQQAALDARSDLAGSRQELILRRQRFAALEQQALSQALASGGAALNAGDTALAAGEDVERLRGAAANSQSIRTLARQLAAEDPAPARPVAGERAAPRPPFAYALPASAPVTEGLGAVDESGVRSRGLTMATARGTAVTAPAAGTIRYAGPFRDYDGVVIIDHGGGWMSLIVNASSSLKPGDRVRLGDPLGRALGPLEVELSHYGRRFSPALIAGSSETLSNAAKGG
jgi:murein hydrolase activator